MPPRPRLDDVAARAGVSTASVSLVLRELPGPSAATRRAVREAAHDLGYRPDRSASLLARRRTQLLGVMMDVSNAFHAELLEEIHAAADERGYDVVVSPLTRRRDERRAVETLVDSRCEALLLMAPMLPIVALAELAADHHVVAIGRRVSAAGVDVVRAADAAGVALAVEHLAALGHRAIAFVDGPPGPISTLRRRGYRSVMRRLVGRDAERIVAGGDTEQSGVAAVTSLLDSSPLLLDSGMPSALVAFNDRCALGILDRLRRGGIGVPAAVSVVGYDDSPIARLATVDLTSVSQAPEAMGLAAVQAAVERLEEGRSDPVDVVLEPHLVVRGTTGRPTDLRSGL